MTNASAVDSPADQALTHRRAVKRAVRLVLWNAQPGRGGTERRREKRHLFPYPVRLKSVDATSDDETIVVLGKHLSESGLDFYHFQALADRRMVATFECDGTEVELLLELTWCRFGKHGLYENGGRFVQPFS